MDTFIDHDGDITFSHAAVKQLEGKYLVQNRVTGENLCSAQFLYILVAGARLQLPARNAPAICGKRFTDGDFPHLKFRCDANLCPGAYSTRQFSPAY
ncbi:hypothetical protein ACNKHP_04235 [Shigella boydii]